MPIYEYLCPTCGLFEEMRKVSDPVLSVCPSGHTGVERKISAGGFILKGSGWYVTDYARKGADGGKGGDAAKGADGGKAGKADQPSSGSGEATSSSKPAGSGESAGEPKRTGESKAAPARSGS